jgi:hypothetical protein
VYEVERVSMENGTVRTYLELQEPRTLLGVAEDISMLKIA